MSGVQGYLSIRQMHPLNDNSLMPLLLSASEWSVLMITMLKFEVGSKATINQGQHTPPAYPDLQPALRVVSDEMAALIFQTARFRIFFLFAPKFGRKCQLEATARK